MRRLLGACRRPIDQILQRQCRGGRRTRSEADHRLAHAGVVAIFNGPYGCSGTLIAPRVVLTAAHCIEDYDAQDFLILFGAGSLTRASGGTDKVDFTLRSMSGTASSWT